LKWCKQYEIMKEKMRGAVAKLRNTSIHPSQMFIFYNAYFTKLVYFRYGILSINTNQEKELRAIYKETVLKKLGLSSKFLRQALCIRRSALGVRIMCLSIIIYMLITKLYIGYIK